MKRLILFLCLGPVAFAQLVVHDPANTAVNAAVQAGQAANHLEVMRQWAQALDQLNRQLRQLEDQLAVQQRMRSIMGDPKAAGEAITLNQLSVADLERQYGESLATVRRLADAAQSLQWTAEGVYRPLENRTVFERDFVRQETPYRRYAAVEQQADNLAAVQAETTTRAVVLQADVAATLENLRTASTQAEVDKLSAKLAVLHGQLAQLGSVQAAEATKLVAQQALNENQAAKERQDLLERQQAEERETLAVIERWQDAITVKADTYTRP